MSSPSYLRPMNVCIYLKICYMIFLPLTSQTHERVVLSASHSMLVVELETWEMSCSKAKNWARIAFKI